MKTRTMIYLEKRELHALREEARSQRISLAELLRRVVKQYLDRGQPPQLPTRPPTSSSLRSARVGRKKSLSATTTTSATRSGVSMLVDTGACYALADTSDRHHEEAKRFYTEQRRHGILRRPFPTRRSVLWTAPRLRSWSGSGSTKRSRLTPTSWSIGLDQGGNEPSAASPAKTPRSPHLSFRP